MIEELLQRLKDEHGLSPQQATGVLQTISGFIKEKFPMAAGMLDQFLPGVPPAAGTAATDPGDFLDGVSGRTGEDLADIAKSKLGGLFGKDNS